MCRGPVGGTGVFIPPAVLAHCEATSAPGAGAAFTPISPRDNRPVCTPRPGFNLSPGGAISCGIVVTTPQAVPQPAFSNSSSCDMLGTSPAMHSSWSGDDVLLFEPLTPAGLARPPFGGSARSSFDAAPYVSAPQLAVSAGGPCTAELPLDLVPGGAWLVPALDGLAYAPAQVAPTAVAGAPAPLLSAQLAMEQELQAIDAHLSELLAQKEALQRTRMQARSCAISALGCPAALGPEPLRLCVPQQQLQPAAAYVQAAAGTADGTGALAASMEAVAAHNKLEELMAMQQLQLVLQQELLQLLPLAG